MRGKGPFNFLLSRNICREVTYPRPREFPQAGTTDKLWRASPRFREGGFTGAELGMERSYPKLEENEIKELKG